MRRLFCQMIRRPADALASSLEMFGQQLPGRQLIDGIVSRLVYGLSRPPGDASERERKVTLPGAPETAPPRRASRGAHS